MFIVTHIKKETIVEHIAIIQSEFVKYAIRWNAMSPKMQRDYLKKHPKSKRKFTAKPRMKHPEHPVKFEGYQRWLHENKDALRDDYAEYKLETKQMDKKPMKFGEWAHGYFEAGGL